MLAGVRPALVLLTALAAAALVAPGALGHDDEAAPALSVTESRGKGPPSPCPPLRATDAGELRGGCVVRASSTTVEMSVLSVVEELPFGSCYFSYDLRIDARGRVALTDLAIGGASPCNDAPPCFEERTIAKDVSFPPWRGRLVARDGEALDIVVDACLDTCMGRFAGLLEIRMDLTDGGSTAWAANASIGDSGWRLNGSWGLDADHIAIARNDDGG